MNSGVPVHMFNIILLCCDETKITYAYINDIWATIIVYLFISFSECCSPSPGTRRVRVVRFEESNGKKNKTVKKNLLVK